MDATKRIKKRRARGTAQLFEQVARRILEKRHRDDLHAAQWSALRYFQRAGRQTANVIGLSQYLGNTSGSTSRTARSLVDRALLTVSPAEHDARSVTFRLTPEGEATLAEDPMLEIAAILDTLPPQELALLSKTLDTIQTELLKRRTPE
ncbi:MarR family winged helix-turn-helix transcriptional regulator [Parvularcula sp. LCG005]|uniref:MarR family winged helix-turn-helix transcriptional regulator n=1 Tax=Parvularcula sp. LCG005 TaxID=3078805 RepID=UPI002942997A|nr:MarR family transcriptional regulator [Parvularcula sp. LCG005]WOI52800.1 MarR family transcriptional regulator [Parvularcula sp. LCG005]